MAEDARPDDFEAGLRPLWLRAQSGDERAYRAALSASQAAPSGPPLATWHGGPQRWTLSLTGDR